MKRRFLHALGYLLIPEDSTGPIRRVTAPGTQSFPGVSVKAVFWAGMAVAVALIIGRLS